MVRLTLVNDLVSVESFVKATFPTARTEKQTPPKKPSANLFVIRFLNDGRESETAAHFRIDREFQLIYYGSKSEDALTKMDALSKALYQRQVIPINGTLRYLRVKSFAYSQPFETENDLYACVGILAIERREARDTETYAKIMNVHTTITVAP